MFLPNPHDDRELEIKARERLNAAVCGALIFFSLIAVTILLFLVSWLAGPLLVALF